MTDLSIFHEMPNKSPASIRGELMGLFTELHKLFEPYRPELHYMRGPGPKWHAKHAAHSLGSASQDQMPIVIRNVSRITYIPGRPEHPSYVDAGPGIANRGGIVMLNIRATIVAIAAITAALFAFSANAHEYRPQGNAASQTNQWDLSKAAPFARDENDRFTP